MARQSRTITPTPAHVLSHLDRMTSVARKNARIAHAAASIALGKGYRWYGFKGERFVARPGSTDDGSGSGFSGGTGWHETESRRMIAAEAIGRHRATALVEAASRSHRPIPELSQAMKALSRIERSAEYAPPMSDSNTARSRAAEGPEPKVSSSADRGLLASVRTTRSIRGMTPPPNVTQREFAQPSGNRTLSSAGSGRGGITINSSPTVVINGSGGNAVQHDVIGALRAHREELFDQLKRESARRERAQF